MVRIRCVVERITYQNQENGYSVLKTRVKGYSELVPVVGNLLDARVGSVLIVEGTWKVDARYGRQFMAEKWEETVPATVYGIEKYLGSGLIKGVGPKFAKRIVEKFGTETITVLDTQPERLSEVEGIGGRRVKQIRESWARQKEIKNVMLFLQSNDVSTAFAARIYKAYGDKSIETVKENPYRLADDIWGIGFRTADTIARKLGFEASGFARVRSGIFYTLNTLGNEGHIYAERGQLVAKAVELLGVEEDVVNMTLDHMMKIKDVIIEEWEESEERTGAVGAEHEDRSGIESGAESITGTGSAGVPGAESAMMAIYLPAFYYAEVGVAGKLRRLGEAPGRITQDMLQKRGGVDIGKLEALSQIRYDEVQADAIRQAVSSKVMVLTGGPGTGKTTTTQGIIAALRTFGLKILLAAPTGRAAKRMSEATGMEAKTIHRLLECKPPEGYGRNEQNPLEGDALIVDECSMIDMMLMNSLLKAIPEHMMLILVGDIDQLPSVGPGNVLRDIIDSEHFPVVRLTRIFRQAQSSRIIMNAHRINRGEFPDCRNGRDTDFYFMAEEDPDEAARTIVDLVKTKLPRYYHVPSSAIQVLTPMQRGVIGAANLNVALQAAINPGWDARPGHGADGERAQSGGYGRSEYAGARSGYGRSMNTGAALEDPSLTRGGYTYRIGDRVMQIRNNYDKDVYNGDIGTVSSVDTQERTLCVDYDGRSVEYDITELDEVVLAYAVTIHKSQGSEYPMVVMPVMMNHYVMLQRNLIYTGITRAKKLIVLVGTKKALAYAVGNVTVTKRNTRLKERLSGDMRARKLERMAAWQSAFSEEAQAAGAAAAAGGSVNAEGAGAAGTQGAKQSAAPFTTAEVFIKRKSPIEVWPQRFISFDTETTGLNPARDRIVEVGAVLFEDGEMRGRFSSLVDPGMRMPAAAMAVNHITNQMLAKAPPERDMYPELIRFFGDAMAGETVVIAHNAKFDMNFLTETFRRLGYGGTMRFIDTLRIARWMYAHLENRRQETLAGHFGIRNRAAHRAVTDAEVCGQIYLKMRGEVSGSV